MALRIVNPDPRYAPPTFVGPPPAGYLYLGAAVAPPAGPPLVRPDARRAALLARLKQLASELRGLDVVERVTVYRGVLVPPARPGARHPARYDVAVLIEAVSPRALDDVAGAAPYEGILAAIRQAARDVYLMPARCVRCVGDVDKSRPGLFLFNHFVADDAEVATTLWEHLAGWYVAETGLANSTLLAPLGPSDYVLVNHARWDKSLPRVAAEQFAKKTFRGYVLANLRANHVTAMPALYRLA